MAYSENVTPFVLSANIPDAYSAAHLFSTIPLTKSILLSGLARGILDDMCSCGVCTVRIYGALRGEVFVKREISLERFRLADYILEGSDSICLDLSEYRILPDADFFAALHTPAKTTVTVSVTVGAWAVSRSYGIRLLPYGCVSPEMPPELYAAYVMPGCGLARRASDTYSNMRARLPKDNAFYKAELCASVMRSTSVTFSPLLPELPTSECIIRDYDNVASSNNRSLSLTEAAFLYCSMAENIGLRPTVIFLRRDSDAVKALVGISVTDKFFGAVCESASELRERILSKELFLFDISGLLGTEAADFSRNVSETTSSFLRMNASSVIAVDIAAARALGVRSVRPCESKSPTFSVGEYGSISEAVERIDELGRSRALFGFSPYSARALGICARANSLEFGKVYTALAIDEEVLFTDPDSFSFISTFRPESPSEHPRNMTERALYDSKIKRMLSRIESERSSGNLYAYSAGSFLSGKKLSGKIIRDDFNLDVGYLYDAVRSRLFSDGHVEIYAATGIVTYIHEGRTVYAPCAYVPCRLSVDPEAVRLTYGTGRAVLNSALADITEPVLGSVSTDTENAFSGSAGRQGELSDILSHYARLSNYDSEFEYHPDTFLSVFDLSCILMRGCIESTDGKAFEQYALDGKYVKSDEPQYGFARTELPLGVNAALRDAILCADNDSIIITGPGGSGKNEAAVSIAVRSHNAGEDTLICSDYSESLDSVRETLERAGLAELSVTLRDDARTREKLLADISLLMTPPEAPEDREGDVSELEELLDRYSQALHESRSFGLSLYDCIDEYCRCSEKTDEETLSVRLNSDCISEKELSELLETADGLCEMTRQLSESIVGSSPRELMLDRFGINAPVRSEARQLLRDTASELSLFSEKSSAARQYLGIPHKALTDIRALRAFGDFLESVIFSGIDFMPEGLLGTGVYANAKAVEEVCTVIDELKTYEGTLDEVSEEINEISAVRLYDRWQAGETNPFIRASVMHEIKKYIPSTRKISYREAGGLLAQLSRRETLREELARLAPECSQILGGLWRNVATDTETARRAARFAVLSDSCSSKISRGGGERVDLRRGIGALIEGLKKEGEARADLLLSAGAFRKLSGKGGLLDEISSVLCTDPYELSFDEGLLSENGLSRLLLALSDNTEALGLLPEYNALKKRAQSLGISSFTEYAKDHDGDPICKWVFKKSIYSALARALIDNDSALYEVTEETFLDYVKLCNSEKARCIYSVVSEHREGFVRYVSEIDGKRELRALIDELKNPSFTIFEIYARHAALFRQTYSIILAESTDAYRFPSYPSRLILLDCDKTDAARALPLCAHFDKCVFLTSGNDMAGSIMKHLPKGLPSFRAGSVGSCKNTSVLGLCARFNESLTDIPCRKFADVHFIKCEGGIYDRGTRTNRIEALKTCETALEAAKKHGLESVGILASTAPQASEIIQILGVLSRKYGDRAIASIPVRYIGRVGDFSKDTVVLSVTFGKNVYSVTRSFGIFDSYAYRNGVSRDKGLAALSSELLCARKHLYVVASAEPSDILTDTCSCGADFILSLLAFAKYGVIPKKPREAEGGLRGGIERTLAVSCYEDGRLCASAVGGVLRFGDSALIYDFDPDLPCYDRTVLRYTEHLGMGCSVRFVPPTSLLPNDKEDGKASEDRIL